MCSPVKHRPNTLGLVISFQPMKQILQEILQIIQCLKHRFTFCFYRLLELSELLGLFLQPAFLKQRLILQILGNMRFWGIVAFQSQCLPRDKKTSSGFLLQNQKNCRCSLEARSLGWCQNFKNIWTFWISLFLLAQHLLMMYSGFCRCTQLQAWSSGCVLDQVVQKDLGHCVLHFHLLSHPANEFSLFHFTGTLQKISI